MEFKNYILFYKLKLVKEELGIDDEDSHIFNGLLKDKEFILKVMEYQPSVYGSIGMDLKKDVDIATLAFIKDKRNFYSTPKGMFKNEEYLAKIFEDMNTDNFTDYYRFLKINIDNFDLFPYDIKKDRYILIRFLQAGFKEIIPKINYSFHDDYEIMNIAIENDPNMIEYASLRLRDDKDIILKVICKDINLLRYASKRILEEFSYVIDAELFSRNNKWLEEVD